MKKRNLFFVSWKKCRNFVARWENPNGFYIDFITFSKKRIVMIIVPVKEGENIEKALKKFKRKSEKTGVIKEVRNRKQFNKPSVVKRIKMQHAVYVNKLHLDEEA